jgi:hypothetical protein
MVEAALNLLAQSSSFMTHFGSLLTLVAGIVGGIFASYATWHLTDRLLARRQRAELGRARWPHPARFERWHT